MIFYGINSLTSSPVHTSLQQSRNFFMFIWHQICINCTLFFADAEIIIESLALCQLKKTLHLINLKSHLTEVNEHYNGSKALRKVLLYVFLFRKEQIVQVGVTKRKNLMFLKLFFCRCGLNKTILTILKNIFPFPI